MGDYFRGLAYSLGDEDSRIEREIVPYEAGRVLTIAGSGGRVIPLLSRAPKLLEVVDISPEQIAFTRFRLAALSALDVEEYIRLLGYGPKPMLAQARGKLIDALSLSATDKKIMRGLHQAHFQTPLVYTGKFELTLRKFSRIIRVVLGKRVHELFEITDLTDQIRFLRTRFPSKRWKMIVALLGNATLLNTVLYKGDFPKKNRPETYFRIYNEIFQRLFERVLARNSFFLQILMLGEVLHPQGYPVECDPETYAQAKTAFERSRVKVRKGDITGFPEEPTNGIDFISLSDVPTFLDNDTEKRILSYFAPYMSSGGKVVVRSHLRVLPPIAPPLQDVTDRYCDFIATETTNLWCIAVAERAEGCGDE